MTTPLPDPSTAADKPWLARADWASGRMSTESATGTPSTRGFLIVALLIGGVVVYLMWMSQFEPSLSDVLPVLLLIPLVVLLYIPMRRASARRSLARAVVLELGTVPGVIGWHFKGTLRVPGRLPPEVRLVLECNRIRVVGTTTSHRRTRNVYRAFNLWQHETLAHAEEREDGSAVPFSFVIPADAEPTGGPREEYIAWVLTADASIPALQRARFDVPVFRTEESDQPDPDAMAESAQGPVDVRQPVGSRVVLTESIRGTELFLPGGRLPGYAMVMTVAATVLAVVTYGLVTRDVQGDERATGIFLGVVAGIFCLVYGYAALRCWFGTITIQADTSEVVVRKQLLGYQREQTFPASELARIELWESPVVVRTDFDLRFISPAGVKSVVKTGFRTREEAQWVIAVLRRVLKHADAIG